MSERYTVHLDEVERRLKYHSTQSNRVLYEGEIDSLIACIGKCAVANGCFDILHPGHLTVLATLDTEAYSRRLRPIVAMNSDESVRRLKGHARPFVQQKARSMLINSLKWPLTVVIFDEDSPQRLMDVLKPQLVVKGSEYPAESVVKWKNSEVISVPMLSDWSTSKILGDTR